MSPRGGLGGPGGLRSTSERASTHRSSIAKRGAAAGRRRTGRGMGKERPRLWSMTAHQLSARQRSADPRWCTGKSA
eukprot:1524704-Alexandrium_andersonii.AAC.1